MIRGLSNGVNVFNNIKCLQINLRRSRAATAHLVKYITEKSYDVVLIQEPYHIKNKVCGLPKDYRVYYNDKEEVPKTAVVVTNPKIQVVFIQAFSNYFSTFVKMQFKQKSFTILSLYCSPFQPLEEELLLIKQSLSVIKPSNLIICMDSNAKSQVWFNQQEDSRGRTLIEFISESNLNILNDNESEPTFCTSYGSSHLDLTISDLSSLTFIKEWKVLTTESLSDHRYIEFIITDEIPSIDYKTTIKYNTKNSDWGQFINLMELQLIYFKSEINSITSSAQLNKFIESFSERIFKFVISFLLKNLIIIHIKLISGGRASFLLKDQK
jgi:hypothetical protein